ncbi:MAG: DUF3506 domain-containing protein [Gammaproteobacteria bacterium]|nr:MAG: DUF3506 domain-containing protein [Gammaproteobacteria bacterium]
MAKEVCMSLLSIPRWGFLLLFLVLLPACAGSPPDGMPDLRGQWIGEYPCCGVETIEVSQRGHRVQATKVTGDDYVPAGEVTWRASVESGEGEGQIADKGFANARFIAGTLTVLDHDTIQFEWGQSLTVIYSRVD